MIHAIALVLGMQLIGEGIARIAGFSVPGPVIGLVLLALLLAVLRSLRPIVEPLANTLLGHLSLLFVPAAVGLIQHLGVFANDFWPLILALSLSTLLTLVVTATVFVLVDRWVGSATPPEEAS
ncbi:MAG: CidA/LrgA family protein [Hyphomicrobiales bacterium]|jgi:holin-like protein